MKQNQLLIFKQSLEVSKTKSLNDDNLISFIKCCQALNKEEAEQKSFIETLQKQCDIKFKESGELDNDNTPKECIIKFEKLYNDYGEQQINLVPFLNQAQFIAFKKENDFSGLISLIIYENLVLTLKKSKDAKQN